MNKKILFSLSGLVSFAFLLTSIVQAQQPTQTSEDQIPSDLSLDLDLAKKNPDPDRQTIVNSETKQAQVVSTSGEVISLKPQDVVALEVKTESKNDAQNPDQTTSEQVVTTPVEIEETVVPSEAEQNQTKTEGENQPTTTENTTNNLTPLPSEQIQETPESQGPPPENPSGAIVPTASSELVPSTSVVSPNDNAAPSDNSSNPNLPAPTSAENPTANPQPTSDNSQPQTQVTNPPAENPSTSSDNGGQQTNPPPANDSGGGNSQPPPSDSSNTSVQGAETGPGSLFSQIMKTLLFWRK